MILLFRQKKREEKKAIVATQQRGETRAKKLKTEQLDSNGEDEYSASGSGKKETSSAETLWVRRPTSRSKFGEHDPVKNGEHDPPQETME